MKLNRRCSFGTAGVIVILAAGLSAPAFGQNANDGFNPDVNGAVFVLAVQAHGKIVIGGGFTTVGGMSRDNIARLNVDGSVDTAFNPGADSSVYYLAVQPDGKILVAGDYIMTLGGQPNPGIGRVNTDGRRDTAFKTAVVRFV